MGHFTKDSGMKSAKSGLIALAGFSMTAMAPSAFAQREMPSIGISQYNIDHSLPVIDLTVSGTSETAPDTANFTTGVETRALKAREAIRLNAEKMKGVIAQLKAQGIAEADVQTNQLSLTKEYTYPASGKRRFKGYLVSNNVTVKLRDLTKLADMLDLLATQGGNEFSGPDFYLEKDAAASTAARDDAWDMAYTQARYHAKKAGFTGVRVVRVSESVTQNQNSGETLNMMRVENEASTEAASDVASSPIMPGMITTSVTLTILFEMVK
jgi:uncharacterized protein